MFWWDDMPYQPDRRYLTGAGPHHNLNPFCPSDNRNAVTIMGDPLNLQAVTICPHGRQNLGKSIKKDTNPAKGTNFGDFSAAPSWYLFHEFTHAFTYHYYENFQSKYRCAS